MRRLYLGLLGLAVVGMAIASTAAQAATTATAGAHHTATTRTYVFGAQLPSAVCSAMRQSLHNPKASCTRPTVIRLKVIKKTSSDTYEIGSVETCAQVNPNYTCNPNAWWTTDDFGVTYSGTQAWNNVHTCYENHTGISWCGYSGNGTGELKEGYNFGGPSGTSYYIRLPIHGDGTFGVPETNTPGDIGVCSNSWSNTCS